jgi:predicted ATPase
MASEVLLLTGIPSAGKARLRIALQDAGLAVSATGTLRVHAETDLEGLVEPGLLRAARAAAARADIVIPVDWERPHDSVRRVAAFLARRV